MNTYDTNRNNNRNDWFDDDRKLVNETKKFCIPNHATLSNKRRGLSGTSGVDI